MMYKVDGYDIQYSSSGVDIWDGSVLVGTLYIGSRATLEEGIISKIEEHESKLKTLGEAITNLGGEAR